VTVTDDRYDQLKPPHLVSALRSFPRRYREALANVSRDPELLVQPVDGHTALTLVAGTSSTLDLIDRALERTLVQDDPELTASVVVASARTWQAREPSAIPTLLDELTTHATALADRLDRAPTAGWLRVANVDGRRVRAVDLAREAVRMAAENLRLLERIVASLG
jgi:hypothetical protein